MYIKRPLTDYPEYQIDTNGILYGKNGSPMSPTPNHRGYPIANLMVNGKRIGIAIHTLVAQEFLGKQEAPYQVNHINGIKTDNRLVNLEWVTPLENVHHAINQLGFTPGAHSKKPVIGINKHSKTVRYTFNSLIEAGTYFNPNNPRRGQNDIWRVLSGLRKSYKGCIWKYNDLTQETV